MKKSMKMSLVILAAAALGAGGCAKQQVIKQDQMIPQAESAATAAPVKTETPAAVKADRSDAALAATQVNEAQAAQQGQQPAAAASQAVTESSLKQALDKVFFDFDSYTLSADARQALTKNAEILKQTGNLKVRIEGNCDELGSDDYNLALGEKRASAAKSYLETLGVPAERLSIISYGKERPAAPGHDDAARAQNRRDEFVITSK